jgi:hypothetical protein
MNGATIRINGDFNQQELKVLLKETYGDAVIIEGEDFFTDDTVVALKDYRGSEKKNIFKGEICTVLHQSDSGKSYWIQSITTGIKGCLESVNLVHATPDQVETAEKIGEEIKLWKSLGREYKVFKEGDIVALDQGTIGVIKQLKPNGLECLWGDETSNESHDDVRMICSVERRFDRK